MESIFVVQDSITQNFSISYYLKVQSRKFAVLHLENKLKKLRLFLQKNN